MTMTLRTHGTRQVLSPDEADARLVEIEKGQQLASHFPSAEALARARRILIGEMTLDEARAEIIAKYSE
jgi:hypothetical protein